MKKKISLCITLLLASLLAIICAHKFSAFSSSEGSVKETIFFNQLQEDQSFQLKLFYTDPAMEHLKSLLLTSHDLSVNNEALAPYTEGFLPQETNKRLLEAVNTYRQEQSLAPLTYFYHYQEVGDFAFVSSSEGLNALYFVNLNTLEISVPHIKSEEAYNPQYVYHIQEVNNIYYILTAGVNNLKARLYAFSPSTLDLTLVGALTTDTTALSSKQYALDTSGNAIFTHKNGLKFLTTTGLKSLDLSFTPEQIISSKDIIGALTIQNGTLLYALVNSQLELLDTGSLTLPSTDLSLINSFIQNDLLYTITYDQEHPIYRHYVSIYSLTTKTSVFCVGLSDYDGLALLQAELLP